MTNNNACQIRSATPATTPRPNLGIPISLALLLVSICSASSAGETPATFVFPKETPVIELPVQRGFLALLAEIRINGQEAGLFLIHTGTAGTLIERSLAERLRLPAGPQAMVQTPAGPQLAQRHRLDRCEWGGLRVEGLTVTSMDLSRERRASGVEQLQGVLGLDVLGRIPFQIDHRRTRMQSWDPKVFTPPIAAPTAPIIPLAGGLWLRVDLPGTVHTLCRLISVFPGHLTYGPRLKNEHPALFSAPAIPTSSGVGHALPAASIADIESGPVTVTLNQAPPQVREVPDGIAGMAFMRRYALTIDLAGRRAIWVEPVPADLISTTADQLDSAGATDLLIAAACGELIHLRGLMAAGVRLNHQDSRGNSALHHAVSAGEAEAVTLLLAAGATPGLRNRDGQRPLDLATALGHRAVIAQLQAADGAPADQPSTPPPWRPSSGPAPQQTRSVEVLQPPSTQLRTDWRGVATVDARHAWVVGGTGTVITTSDGGVTWTEQELASRAIVRAVWFHADGSGVVVGDGDVRAPASGSQRSHNVSSLPAHEGSVLFTDHGGLTWNGRGLPTNFRITGVDRRGPLVLVSTAGPTDHLDGDILVGSPSEVFTIHRLYRALNGITAIDDRRWCAVGSSVSVDFNPRPTSPLFTQRQARAVWSTDGGATWHPARGSDGRGQLRAVSRRGTVPGALIAVGDQGAIRLSHDGGQTWTTSNSGVTANLHSVASHADTILAVGDGGLLLTSTDSGQSWSRLSAPGAANLRSVAAWQGLFLVGGDRGALWRIRVP